MVDNGLISRQYQMAALCESSLSHLGLAEGMSEENERKDHLQQALDCSQGALEILQEFGFVQVIECSAEEIYYRHSRTLSAHGRASEAREFFERAYRDMMRKYELIPVDSHYRHTYLENITLHREIRSVYQTILLSGEWP